ncbi:MAG: DUF4906 domain-containing protein [Bacteroidales bacterium]|nr:DUF4906 domain-containing protein [Bacteroidales bacterium]
MNRLRVGRRIVMLILIPALCLISCQADNPGDSSPVGNRKGGRVTVSPYVEPAVGYGSTKSAFVGDTSCVADYNLLLFSDGLLAAKYYVDSGKDMEFEAVSGKKYEYFCVANVGDVIRDFVVGVTSVSSMPEWRVTADVNGTEALPMAMHDTVGPFSRDEIRAGVHIGIGLVRLVARFDFSVDVSGLDRYGFRAERLSICGPSSVTPFSESRASSVAVRSDYAVESDIDRINRGLVTSYYPFENMYGNLLGSNMDPWNKVPSGISESDHPTFLELEGVAGLNGGSSRYMPVKYRFYLGGDATSNFDVKRNTVLTVRLVLTDSGIERDEPSWKVEKGEIVDNRILESLEITPSSLYLPGCGEEAAGGIGYINNAVPNDRHFKLTARFDDGSSEDVTAADGTEWTGGRPLLYKEGVYWHLLNALPVSSASDPGLVRIYRGFGTDPYHTTFRMGPGEENLFLLADGLPVTETTPQLFFSASYTFKGKRLTVPVYGTLVNLARPLAVTIDPTSVEVYAGGHEACFTATAEYDDGTVENISDRAAWTAEGLVTSLGGGRFLSGDDTGDTKVHASITSGGMTVSGEAALTVLPRRLTSVILQCDAGSGWKELAGLEVNLGSSQKWRIIAVYDNGDREALDDGFTLSSSSPSTVSVDGLQTHALAVGSAEIRASYSGKVSSVVRLDVQNHNYEWRLAIIPRDHVVEADGSVSFSASFITFDNGIETGYEDVSDDCTWSLSPNLSSVARFEGTCFLKADNRGPDAVKGTVYATYNYDGEEYGDETGLTVLAPFTPEFSVDASSLEWNYDEQGPSAAIEVTVAGNVPWKAEIIAGGSGFVCSPASGEGNGIVSVYPSGTNEGSGSINGKLLISCAEHGFEAEVNLLQHPFFELKGNPLIYYGLGIEPAESSISVGETRSYQATLYYYRDEAMTDCFFSETTLTTLLAYWSSSDETVAVMRDRYGRAAAEGIGCFNAVGANGGGTDGYRETTITVIPIWTVLLSASANLRVYDSSGSNEYRLAVSVTPSHISSHGTASARALLQESGDGGRTWSSGVDVTSSTAWESSDGEVLSISGDGTVSAHNTGTGQKSVQITGTYALVSPAVSGHADIFVDGGSGEEFLSVSPESLEWDWDESGTGSGKTITVTSNTDWDVSVPEGFAASPLSGSGNGRVTVYPVGNNSGSRDLEGVMVISAGGVASRSISLVQRRNPGTSPSLISIDFDRSHYDLVRIESGGVTTSAPFCLTATYDDGSVRDVTSEATYSGGGMIDVDSGAGILTATGECSGKTIRGYFGGKKAAATYSAEDIEIPVSFSGFHFESQDNENLEFIIEGIEISLKKVLSGTVRNEDVTEDVSLSVDGPFGFDGYEAGRGLLFHFRSVGSGTITFTCSYNGIEVGRTMRVICSESGHVTGSWK